MGSSVVAPAVSSGQLHPFFHTLLVLANETGRRVGDLRHLRYSDLLLDEGEHGKIHFPAEFDKESIDSTVPISAPAERAVRRHLRQFPGIGKAWLFPHPEKEGKPVTRWYPNK